jgi:hypothetical protein
MFRRHPETVISIAPVARRASGRCVARTAMVAVVLLGATSCALGQRPTLEATPTAVGTMTGDQAIDGVLIRMDGVDDSVFTAEYTALLAFGGTTSSITVTQDGSAPPSVRRSVTIGDVRYISTGDSTSTCSVAAIECKDGIDASRVSDTGVTPEFTFGDMAKRLRRDAVARIGSTTASTRDIAGTTATCVDVPVTGGTKQYCVFDSGVLARFVGGDVTIDATSYAHTVNETLFVV